MAEGYLFRLGVRLSIGLLFPVELIWGGPLTVTLFYSHDAFGLETFM